MNTTGVANFAQGEIGLFGTFVAFSVMTTMDIAATLTILVGLVVGVATAAALGVAVERLAVRRVADQPIMTVAVLTLGLYFLVRGVIDVIWGPDIRTFPSLFGEQTIRFGGMAVSVQQLGILVTSFTAALLLGAFLKWTKVGIASRAMVQSPRGAAVSGVPLHRLKASMWGVGLGLAGLAGILIAPVVYLSPNMMLTLLISAFAAATLGGLGSLPGAFIGGLLLGLIESVSRVFVSGSLATAIGLVVILIVLMFRPTGIMGSRYVARV